MPLGDELKFSVPSGAWVAVASVSVAVHCAEVPIWTVEGEQLSVVVVGSTAVAAPPALLPAWVLSPAYEALIE